MRADRLLAILLLLQARGRMTAADIALELEVSERTIYRDIDALSMSGIPIFTERGPGGGCELLSDYRTTLTGLTRDETHALLALTVPEPLAGLEAGERLKSALRKVYAALPPGGAGWPAHSPVYLDWSGWGTARLAGPHLRLLYQAACAGQMVRIVYPMINGVAIEREVAPYGLVGKAGVWYLIGWSNHKTSVHPVNDLLDACLAEGSFERPDDFDLAALWKEHCAEVESAARSYPVRVSAVPAVATRLARRYEGETEAGSNQESGGRVEMMLYFESFWSARAGLLAYGNAVEVLAPEALRRSVQDFGEQIAALYRSN